MKPLNSALVNQSDVFMLLHMQGYSMWCFILCSLKQIIKCKTGWLCYQGSSNASLLEPREICSVFNLVGNLPFKLYILNNVLKCGVRKDKSSTGTCYNTWNFHICVFYYTFKLLKHMHFNKNLEGFGHIVVIKGGK